MMMNLPDFLLSDQYGEIFLTGHRITLYQVLERYLTGESPEALASFFPTVPATLLRKVLSHYRANQAEIDRFLESTRAEIDRQASQPSRGPSLAEMQTRLECTQKSASA